MPTDPADRAGALARELSRWPDLVARLLAEHRDDGNGRCTGCRVPGYGLPGAERWPCAVARLAREAQQLAEQDDDPT